MLVILPKLIQNFYLKLETLSRRYSQRISRFKLTSYLVSALFIFVFALYGGFIPEPETYSTTVKLDTNSPFILTEPDRIVNIPFGDSRNDLQGRGLVHDPESIKLLIQELATEYGVDWRLVYAIGYLESGNFNSSLARRQNNFFGRKASSGVYASWPDVETAVRNQFEYLNTRYLARGMDTPAEMNRVYAESPLWASKVQGIMNSL